MSIVCVRSFAVSLDGFAAGLEQSLEQPLGARGPELMEWLFSTRVWCEMHRRGGGETGVDNRMAALGFQNVGACILGRNMFGPVRGAWPDESWRGWWGDEPPYHVPTFVLTHHSRAPLVMQGGTTFHFVTDGIEAALARAKEEAGERDVRIGGGVATIRQFLQARLIDEMSLAIRPILLGEGESLWGELDARGLGYEVAEHVPGERAVHVKLRRRA